jgi:hypothetical protein
VPAPHSVAPKLGRRPIKAVSQIPKQDRIVTNSAQIKLTPWKARSIGSSGRGILRTDLQLPSQSLQVTCSLCSQRFALETQLNATASVAGTFIYSPAAGAGPERLRRRQRLFQSGRPELHREGDCNGHEDQRRSLDQRHPHRAVTPSWRRACFLVQDCFRVGGFTIRTLYTATPTLGNGSFVRCA